LWQFAITAITMVGIAHRRMIGTTIAIDAPPPDQTAVASKFPEARSFARAVRILRRGGLVAFATETVYGLGADATNASAVRRIFEAKGRPPTNPLIVHVTNAAVARKCATAWPEFAQRLAAALWPGPLTLVLPRSRIIVDEVTAGLDTVALRAPDHPVAQRLLREFGGPVAAPSANRSSRVSPTTAAHVRKDLGKRVDMILDGGPCRVGIESTVLDLTRARPMILRPGGISRQRIEQLIGRVDLFTGSARGIATSPGHQAIHYAPHAAAYRFAARRVAAVLEFARRHPSLTLVALVLADSAARSALADGLGRGAVIQMPADAEQYARRFYAALRGADQRADVIWIQQPPRTPPWAALRDRIQRATRHAPTKPGR
jgi:L-threonylcarbamoyladenylate synthase